MEKRSPRLLIVGAGLTGALCSYFLRRLAGNSVHITVVDMARGPGGRMSTTRFAPRLQGKPSKEIKANTGAQYVSCLQNDSGSDSQTIGHELMEMVSKANPVIAKFVPKDQVAPHEFCFKLKTPSNYDHYQCPQGTNAVVKYFLHESAPQQIFYEARLKSLQRKSQTWLPQVDRARKGPANSNSRGKGGHFSSGKRKGDGHNEMGADVLGEFDGVVLAIPPKDILRLFQGKLSHDDRKFSQADLHTRHNKKTVHAGAANFALPSSTAKLLGAIRYVGRFSLVLWFATPNAFTEAASASFREHDGRFEMLDCVLAQAGGQVLLVQTTTRYWEQAHCKRGRVDKRVVEREVFSSLQRLVESSSVVSSGRGKPQMPRPARCKMVNWRTCQVDRSLQQLSKNPEKTVVADDAVPLVLTGDWAVESSFEGCSIAAKHTAEALLARLRNSSC